MTVQMVLAVVAGLMTSVVFESILLRTREKFCVAGCVPDSIIDVVYIYGGNGSCHELY